ncbi:family 43 glycosylhydrolase [Amphibacillus cookii]|uniref:family 43 glycosylhydrolase n=1 Tax=Amphibacillus cookii TaxID=767787 RepID=UPI00195EAE09|nr:family 43 glycosylhydrolase [Amphibacillus cookii]MBM7539922.1 arabinan endo-1,5-alpha-L-arabinosidase [Amphibacillus cookii]
MKPLLPYILFIISILLLSNAIFLPVRTGAETFEPPVFNEVSVHDPSVIKVDDTYYVFGSHLAAAKSRDLLNWEQISSTVSNQNPLFENVFDELSEAFEWANSDTLWAADVIQIGDQFYMYYNACEGSSPRSAMGLAVADDIEGPYVDHGIFLKSGMWDQESPDGTIYDPTIHPNAIDPHAFFDAEGKFWLLYGSYSGGIFIMELNPKTGMPYEGQGYGTHLIGGNHSRIEGPYMQYDEQTGFYYLHVTYGGLDASGGYNMRVMRSENPDGPFVDATGQQMNQVKGAEGSFFDDQAIEPYGVKLMGNFLFERRLGETGSGAGLGYISPGHNSVYTTDSGESFIFFHTRFPNRGEAHELRVHRLVINSEGWPVIAPYRYSGEQLEAISADQVVGTYKYINHGLDISSDLFSSEEISLQADGTISGVIQGSWEMTNDYDIALTIDNVTYHGMVLRQWNEVTESFDLTFAAVGSNNISIAGSQTIAYNPETAVKESLAHITFQDSIVIADLSLPKTGVGGTTMVWQSSDPNVINEAGEVKRPMKEESNREVTLTVTATNDQYSETKTFKFTVLAEFDQHLAAYYPFDNGLNDYTQQVDDGEVTGRLISNTGGQISYQEGQFGQALYLDGTSGVRLPDGLLSGEHYSISFWLKPERLTDFTTAFFAAHDQDNWFSFTPRGHNGETMLWSLENGNWFDGYLEENVEADVWSHLALTNHNGELTLYLNGEQAMTFQNFNHVLTDLNGVFALGVNFWDAPYQGLIDELVLYQSYTLTDQDVKALYSGDIPLLDNLNDEDLPILDGDQSNEEDDEKTKDAVWLDSSEGLDQQMNVRLPDTSSAIYHRLGVGVILVLLGIATLLFQKAKSN